MKTKAPGKLILTGEYAVLFGGTALALAASKYVTTDINTNDTDKINFSLLGEAFIHTHDELSEYKHNIDARYKAFKDDELDVTDILVANTDLARYIVADMLARFTLPSGFDISIEADLPIGSGMGSSAAAIVSLLSCLQATFNLKLEEDIFMTLATQYESLQHGQSSGLDIYISKHGGLIEYSQGMMNSHSLPELNFYAINTGAPESSTGECVAHVIKHYRTSDIWQEFKRAAHAMLEAIRHNDGDAISFLISQSHTLLHQLGIVPKKVDTFIHSLSEHGIPAKMCGAGSLTGDHAGMLLAIVKDPTKLKSLCDEAGYTVERLMHDTRGAHVS